MADTGGIAALMKALNETPPLGSGLRASGTQRTTGVARASNVVRSTSAAQTGVAALQSARAALASASTSPAGPSTQTQPLPKIVRPEGKGFDPKAPKGSYLNLVV